MQSRLLLVFVNLLMQEQILFDVKEVVDARESLSILIDELLIVFLLLKRDPRILVLESRLRRLRVLFVKINV